MAGRASVELHTLIFFRGKEVVADARITKVRLPQANLECSFWPVRAIWDKWCVTSKADVCEHQKHCLGAHLHMGVCPQTCTVLQRWLLMPRAMLNRVRSWLSGNITELGINNLAMDRLA